jgi:5-formaminoimidazole-4-carboxamide-1-beta-D-ribofuranosyl 5'-monophosphate synthetase
VANFATKYLSASGVEDEAIVKKLSAKREKGFFTFF